MKKSKMHKIDFIFFIGIIIIALLGGLTDYLCWKDYEGSGGVNVKIKTDKNVKVKS